MTIKTGNKSSFRDNSPGPTNLAIETDVKSTFSPTNMPGQTPPVLEALSLEQFFKNAGMDAEHVEKYCAAIQQTNAVPAEPSLQDLSQLSKRNSWSFLGVTAEHVSAIEQHLNQQLIKQKGSSPAIADRHRSPVKMTGQHLASTTITTSPQKKKAKPQPAPVSRRMKRRPGNKKSTLTSSLLAVLPRSGSDSKHNKRTAASPVRRWRSPSELVGLISKQRFVERKQQEAAQTGKPLSRARAGRTATPNIRELLANQDRNKSKATPAKRFQAPTFGAVPVGLLLPTAFAKTAATAATPDNKKKATTYSSYFNMYGFWNSKLKPST